MAKKSIKHNVPKRKITGNKTAKNKKKGIKKSSNIKKNITNNGGKDRITKSVKKKINTNKYKSAREKSTGEYYKEVIESMNALKTEINRKQGIFPSFEISEEVIERVIHKNNSMLLDKMDEIQKKFDRFNENIEKINNYIEVFDKLKVFLDTSQDRNSFYDNTLDNNKGNLFKSFIEFINKLEGYFLFHTISKIYLGNKSFFQDLYERDENFRYMISDIKSILGKNNIEMIGEFGEELSYKEAKDGRKWEIEMLDKIDDYDSRIKVLVPGFKYNGKFFIKVIAQKAD